MKEGVLGRAGHTLSQRRVLLQNVLSPSWKFCLLIFIAGRLIFSLWGVAIWGLDWPTDSDNYYYDVTPIKTGTAGALLGVWQRWDSIHYQRIASGGYYDETLSAFFPLLPISGRIAAYLTGGNTLISLIIISNLAFLFAIKILYDLLTDQYTEQLARASIICLILFPTSMFFYSIYPQSLALLLILLAYRASLKNQWFLAGIASLFAGLTHPTAVLLSILTGTVAIKAILRKTTGSRLAPCIASGMNLVGAAMFMLWRSMEGFIPYASLQEKTWGHVSHSPVVGLLAVFNFVRTLTLSPTDLVHWIHVAVFIAQIVLMVRSYKKIATELYLYQIGILLLFLSSNSATYPLHGFMRYFLIAFPFFISAAMFHLNKPAKLILFSFSAGVNFYCSALFFLWNPGFS